MTERVRPYWVGNVTHIDFSLKPFHMVPDPVAPAYSLNRSQPPTAKVIRFTKSKKSKRPI